MPSQELSGKHVEQGLPTAVKINRYRVLNTPVDAVDMEGALAFVDVQVRKGSGPRFVLAVNPEKVYVLRENAFLRKFFEDAGLLIPDGIGMVKALRVLHGARVSRVPGADLMQRICGESVARGYRIFVYGGAEEVNEGAVHELERRYPGIHIVGRANGYLSDEEMPALVERINASGAEVLFVALGSPRQERWLSKYGGQLANVRVCQGIGGTLDTIVGRVKRAPDAFQKLGLEWLYRLLKQPSRAGRQLRLIHFAMEILRAKLCSRGRSFAGARDSESDIR